MASRRGRPIWAAYNDTGALSVPCPHCEADPGTWCTKPDGRVARTPCVARAANAIPGPHDFGEPRRTQPERTP